MAAEAPKDSCTSVESTLIGQSIQVPHDAHQDDTSVLGMSWHDNGFTKFMNPARSEGIPHSVSTFTLQTPRQDSNPKQERPSSMPRPVLRSSKIPQDDELEGGEELSKLAEAAAFETFGAAATQKDGMVRRKSALVANDSSLGASWFASRGLMSRRSFEKYKKEMKQARRRNTVTDEDESARFLSSAIGMENEDFDLTKLGNSAPDAGRKLLKEGRDDRSSLSTRRVHKSRSLDNGLDHLVRTFVSALVSSEDGEDKEKQVTMSGGKLFESITRGDTGVDSKLTNEEIALLTKVMIKCINGTSKPQESNLVKDENKMLVPQNTGAQDDKAVVLSDSLQDEDISICLDDLISDSKNMRVHSSESSETLKRSTIAGKKAKENERSDASKSISGLYKYAPKRMNSKEVTIDSDHNCSDVSNMAVLSLVKDQEGNESGLDTPITAMKSFRLDNESLTSIQPLACFNRGNSGLTEIVCEDLNIEKKADVTVVTTQLHSPLEPRTLTPPRQTSFRETNVMPVRRSSGSLEFDYGSLDGPLPKEGCGDILKEGMMYLSMAMLVNVYGKLREMSILGHASVKFVDLDVNSHQRISRLKEMKRRGMLEELKIEESKGFLDNTKTSEFVVRMVLDEYEMFEASSELSPIYSVSKANMQYDASLLAEFKEWVEESKVKQIDTVTERIIKKLHKESAMRESMIRQKASYGSLSSVENVQIGKTLARRRKSLETKSHHSDFQASSWPSKERRLIEDHFGVNNDDTRTQGVTSSLIEKKIQESSSDYFEQGSVMRNLLESGMEVVWFSDRHPNDLIYCICVNRQINTVTVLFRADESTLNLMMNSGATTYPNPISHEEYSGNSDFIKLRSVIADEMLRARRDTKISAVDEIKDKVDQIGHELDPTGKYHVSVAGHGMAGGMASVLGYFLASDPAFKSASAVRVFSFASSRIGDINFQNSFQHLEKSGRILYARFTNSHDLSFLPLFSLNENWMLSGLYKDVGMRIRLHKSTYAGRKRTKQSLDVTYSTTVKSKWIIAECLVFVISLLSSVIALSRGGWKRNSKISVYQSRMHFAREYRIALGGAFHRFDVKRKNLKSLNDYYLMKCRCVENYAVFKKQNEGMSWFLLFIMVSSLISFEVALLFSFVSKW